MRRRNGGEVRVRVRGGMNIEERVRMVEMGSD